MSNELMENRIGLILTPLYKNHILNTTVLELPHTVVGATLAVKLGNPWLALPLALGSHFLLDLIPHWNPSLYAETQKTGRPSRSSNIIIFFDVLLSLIVGFFIAFRFWPDNQRALVILAACFLAVLPDVIEGFYFYFGSKNPLLKKLILWQHSHQGKAGLVVGLLTQAATITIAFYLLLAI